MTGFFRQVCDDRPCRDDCLGVSAGAGTHTAVSSPSRTAETPAAAAPAPLAASQLSGETNADQTRDRLRELLDRHPPSLRDVLRLDPTLLTNADYLAPYPELAGFLAAHPEVAHNPAYYVGTREAPWERNPQEAAVRMWEESCRA